MAKPLNGPAWPHPVSLTDARRGVTLHLDASDADRARIAKMLGLERLEALDADLVTNAWRDGARIEGAWRARIVQICGVSLDPFETALSGDFDVTVVPEGSAQAVPPTEDEIVIDPEADDPPDVLADDQIDLGAYVLEYLALEIDPFPRKPGVAFDAPAEAVPSSPFAALSRLKHGDGEGQA